MKKSVRNKSKVGIWTRIKNIYNNSPWHAAFTYPIAYMISTAVIGGVLASSGFESVGWFFLLIFYLTPLWVLVGLIVSKRRFPYLLSLIVGLGIPIFISFLAYDSFTNSAKKSATKTIHAQTIKYISTEIQKCKSGESVFMNKSQNCPTTTDKVLTGAVNTWPDKNPYDHVKNSVRKSESNTNDKDVGYVSLSASGSNIIIKSCISTPCKKEGNRLQDTIGIE